jgi:hypothetical protein
MRIKIMFAGMFALIAGTSVMSSGIDGSIFTGALITVCSMGLLAVTMFSIHNEKRNATEIPRQRHQEENQKTDYPDSNCEHNWVNPDDPNDMLNYSYLTLRCTECGAERSAWG